MGKCYLGSVRYKHKFSKQFRSEHSLHISQFYSNNDQFEEILNATSGSIPTSSYIYKSGIREYIGRSHYQYHLDNKRAIDFGANVNVKTFRTGFVELSSSGYPNTPDRSEIIGIKKYDPSLEFSLYGDYKQWFSKQLYVIGGMRISMYLYDGFFRPFFQPRAHLSYLFEDGKTAFKAGYSRQNQFAKLLNIGGSGDPGNIWVPATEVARPGSSDIIEAGIERKLGEMYSVSFTGYYRMLNNIAAVENLGDAIDPDNDWQAFISQGSGRVYGAEVMFQKNRGDFTGWISYVFSRSTRLFEELSQDPFLFDFDRTHVAKIYFTYTIDDFWSFGVNYVVGSGQLFTIPIGKFLDSDGVLQLEYGDLNNYRSSPYNRLDISVIKSRNRGGLDQTWKFYVYNLTGTRNPLSITPIFENSSFSDISLERAYLKVVPGVSYVVKF